MRHVYFSEWLESLRKDVECVFGILKARFRILKNAINYHYHEDVENIMFLCCILHNMLLTCDGLDTFSSWENVDWNSMDPDPENRANDVLVESSSSVSEAAAPNNPVPRNFILRPIDFTDVAEFSHGSMYDYRLKREALAVHFSYLFSKGLVKWPRTSTSSSAAQAPPVARMGNDALMVSN